MAQFRGTEMWYGGPDSTAVRGPVRPPGPVNPLPYNVPTYDPLDAYFPPRNALEPHQYLHDRAVPVAPPPSLAAPVLPPSLDERAVPGLPPAPPPSRELPPYEPPVDMVIPGVQHPDGRFEPHPLFARKLVQPQPAPAKVDKHVVELAVPVCCEACEERITNYLGETPGVDAVECDVDTQTVKVVGDLPPADVLQRCKKCFRKSTIVG